jgi:hypothetical protein
MHERIKRIYRSAPMPKYLWVIELSRKELVSRPNPADRKILGEVLIDATENPFDLGIAVVGFHFLGRVFFRHARLRKGTVRIHGEQPYDPDMRKQGSVP